MTHREPVGIPVPQVNADTCIRCGLCGDICQYSAIVLVGSNVLVYPKLCHGCGGCTLVCARFCADKAIEFAPADNGEWFISRTRFGPMVHAALGVAQENSGKLVSLVRTQARDLAVKHQADLVLIDGSPGIGCPVIASITGADLVLVVTEPTLSGLHDLGRVTELTKHFDIPTLVCINKWDLNAELTNQIETAACQVGATVVGRIRYDRAVTEAQIKKQTLVEYTDANSAADVRQLWARILPELARAVGAS